MTSQASSTCPCCHQVLPEVRSAGEELRDVLVARGVFVTFDNRVSESVAAELLGLAPGTLRNWSYGDAKLPYTQVARRRTYRLDVLAPLIELK